MRTIILTSLIIVLSGCVTKIPKSESVLSDKSKAAVVFVEGSGGLISFKPSFGTTISTEIISVDGGTAVPATRGKVREYWLSPGKRTIQAKCEIEMGSKSGTGRGKIETTLEQGKSYLITARAITILGKKMGSAFSCEPIIEEKVKQRPTL